MGKEKSTKKRASLGGKARAESLTAAERSEIAKNAAAARWRGEGAPIKASHDGTLEIGEMELACANLPDGRRVISEAAVMAALGRTYSGYYSQRDASADPDAMVLPRYLAPAGLRPFISEELIELLTPIPYVPPNGTTTAKGVRAEALPKICDVWLKARAAKALTPAQQRTAEMAEILVLGLATVGVIALVDEATGYQDLRTRDALAKILEKFVAKELQKWVRTFPPDFYKEMFRLRGWPYKSDSMARPGVVGRYTTDLVYSRIAPGVRGEILRVIPRNAEGKPKGKLHQMLTEEHGHPRLREHLSAVVALMKASGSWSTFLALIDRALPRFGDTRLLPFDGDSAEDQK